MKTVLNIKTDIKLKKAAQKTAKEAGIPLSLVVNSALKKFISERSITVKAPLVPNAKTAKLLDKALKDIKAEKKLSPVFSNMDEMIRYLHR
jgi:addiction module RelB/DinJ family antitoxin